MSTSFASLSVPLVENEFCHILWKIVYTFFIPHRLRWIPYTSFIQLLKNFADGKAMTANFLIAYDLFLQLLVALCLTGATSALHSVELRIIKNSVTLCTLQENAYFTSHYLLLNYYIFYSISIIKCRLPNSMDESILSVQRCACVC